MAELRISSAQHGDMTNNVPALTIDPKSVDSVTGGSQETEWINPNWAQYWGYFLESPELKGAILMKGIWDVGKGWTASGRTTAILNGITGIGKQTFTEILFSLDITRYLGGDSFAEIIWSEDGLYPINLKVLNPETIKIIYNSSGQIVRYEQTANVKGNKPITFEPKNIFHLTCDRVAGSIHGISKIEALTKTILAEYESFTDLKQIMKRQARPLIIFRLPTDVPSEITSFVTKCEEAIKLGEMMYIPKDKETVDYEVVQVNISQIVMDWRNDIKNKFYRTLGLPQIAFGSSGSTESGGKMEMFAHEMQWQYDQKYLEEQVKNQLFLDIDLVPPQSLAPELAQDTAKDGMAQQLNTQPSDTQAGVGR